ncbi:hypothetical protein ABZ829_27710 [Streptomyces xanthochromogenes]|uniref:hypothetical protein n=1 Tax=Streptomyces xanthochromogenes TaxID=67384 RepID=UPI00341A3E57
MTTTQPASTDTVVREYVQALLRSQLVDEEARQQTIRELEKAGHRLIDGGQTGRSEDGEATWEITDWRTGALLASGSGDHHTYDDTTARLDPDGKWIHIDSIDNDPPEVEPAGLPASLADALQDWLGSAGTSDEDVAEFVGWSVEEVARHRDEA